MEELIKQAKEKYPIGTEFWPAHLNHSDKNSWFKVLGNWRQFAGGSVICDVTAKEPYTPVIYLSDGKWASINRNIIDNYNIV